MAINQKHEKEIIALNTFDAVRLRPQMYIGQINPMEEKLPLIIDGKIKNSDKIWSPGFMHLIIEIMENALDEAKRCRGKMKSIQVTINLDNNEVAIHDSGNGFHDAHKKHSTTKKNVVRTAMEELHAGSNFIDSSVNILGTHGVGSAIVNILSEKFKVDTINRTHHICYEWEDFKVVSELNRHKTPEEKPGTCVSFIPSKQLFSAYKWDVDMISSYLSFKSFLIKSDPIIKKLELSGNFIKDGKKVPIPIVSDFIQGEHITVDSPMGQIFLWKTYEGSASIAFVNGSQCVGIQQKIVNDWCNEYFKFNLAHHFYDTMIVLNVPSRLMSFSDQNKTKYAAGRWEIETEMEENFRSKLIKLLGKSQIARDIEQMIEDRMESENLNKIRRAKKLSKRKISDKYSPPSKSKGSIFLTEGLSAAGSCKQRRDSETEGVYALKGKVKNTRKLSDLSNNKEILDIMTILDIEPNNKKMPCYDKIIIAADQDCIDENLFVITDSGNKKIKDVTYQDKILSHSGNYKDVERIIKTEKDVYIEIEICGEKMICSEHHKLIVFREGKIQEIFAKDLTKKDFMLLLRT